MNQFLYTSIPHNLLIKVLFGVIVFVFKSKTSSGNGFSNTSIYSPSQSCGRKCFKRQTLIDAFSFLITKPLPLEP